MLFPFSCWLSWLPSWSLRLANIDEDPPPPVNACSNSRRPSSPARRIASPILLVSGTTGIHSVPRLMSPPPPGAVTAKPQRSCFGNSCLVVPTVDDAHLHRHHHHSVKYA